MKRKPKNNNPANGGSKWITKERRWAIYKRDEYKCLYCEAEIDLTAEPFTLDHIVPCELGGTNASTNLVTCCKSCNSSKRDKPQRLFFKWLREVKNIDTMEISKRIRRNLRRKLKGNFRI